MRSEKGSMTIVSLILFSVVIILALYVVNLSELQTHYNLSSNEALQHKFILDSHVNYMLKDDRYYSIIEDHTRNTIKTGRNRTKKFNIKDKVLDSRISNVVFLYNRDSDEFVIKLNNNYKNMHRHIKLRGSMINPFFTEGHGGLIVYKESDDTTKEEVDLLFQELQKGYNSNRNLWVHRGDLIIDRNIEFAGILVVMDGDIYTSKRGSLEVTGLIICENRPNGNIRVFGEEDNLSIKLGGVDLTRFLRMDIKARHLLEGLDMN